MATIKYKCENCESSFSVKYDETVCDSDPSFCPFCAEMMFLDDESEDDEDF
jgi:hypothetical protein